MLSYLYGTVTVRVPFEAVLLIEAAVGLGHYKDTV